MCVQSEPLEDFMKKIATATGVPVDKQHLLFRGKVLKVSACSIYVDVCLLGGVMG